MFKSKVAIIGSGNIGTDLMIKIMRLSKVLEMGALVGIDAAVTGAAARCAPRRSDDGRGNRWTGSDAEFRFDQPGIRCNLRRSPQTA